MKKLAFITPLVLLTGCAAMPPPPEANVPAKPSFTSTELQMAIDQAVAQALAAEQSNDIDVEATVNRAVEKAVAQTVRELREWENEKKQPQATQAINGEPFPVRSTANVETEAMNIPVRARVGVTRPMTAHPTVTLKREIRDCALELLMYDTHVADATDACLRIYRSQHLRERLRNDGSTVRTSIVP
jgi:hypothetical protein